MEIDFAYMVSGSKTKRRLGRKIKLGPNVDLRISGSTAFVTVLSKLKKGKKTVIKKEKMRLPNVDLRISGSTAFVTVLSKLKKGKKKVKSTKSRKKR